MPFALPELVTLSFAATFVSMLSAANLGGRVGWAALSDKIGRKKMFTLAWGLGIPAYMLIPYSIEMVNNNPAAAGAAGLGLFVACTCANMTSFGATAATIPAYAADLFGTKYVGAIHGLCLSNVVVAGYFGPVLLAQLRESSIAASAADLAAQVQPAAFEEAFGAPVAALDELLSTQTVTIARLMELVPAGTVDPSPYVYDQTMYAMAGLQAVALFANLMVKPVDPRHHEKERNGTDGGRGK